MDPTTLTERCQDWNQNLSVDASQRLVENIALAGGQSRNGYSYSQAALREAVSLYQEKPVFLDHARDRTRPQDRSTRDLVGSIVNPSYVDGRIRGDIKVLDTESGRTFLNLLEMESPGLGMSHVVRARRSTDGSTVEQIVEVISVDVVVNPATTTTFRESTAFSESIETSSTPSAESNTRQLSEQIAALQAEQERLRQQNAVLTTLVEQYRSQQEIHELLAEAQLPEQAVTSVFLHQLESAGDRSTRQQLISDRLALLSTPGLRTSAVQSRERQALSESTHRDDIFIASLKRR